MSTVGQPNLTQLRVQAKEILQAVRDGQTEAIARVRIYFPSLTNLKLSQAQLVIAREQGYPSWAQLKHDLGVPVGSSESIGNEAFFALIEKGEADAVKQALAEFPQLAGARRRNEYGWESALYAAAEQGNLLTVEALVDAGADVYDVRQGGYPAIDGAIYKKHDEVVEYLLRASQDRDGGLPPTYGCGIDIVLAARHGWLDRVQMHIDRDPFAVYRRGCIGETVLHWPAHNGHVEVLELLLDAGAVIEADEIGLYGGKPLHWAAEHAPECVALLLKHGANPNARNLMKGEFEGFTPLHMCALQRQQSIECAEQLLAAGCDLQAKVARGLTALDVAQQANRGEMVKFLSLSQE